VKSLYDAARSALDKQVYTYRRALPRSDKKNVCLFSFTADKAERCLCVAKPTEVVLLYLKLRYIRAPFNYWNNFPCLSCTFAVRGVWVFGVVSKS